MLTSCEWKRIMRARTHRDVAHKWEIQVESCTVDPLSSSHNTICLYSIPARVRLLPLAHDNYTIVMASPHTRQLIA